MANFECENSDEGFTPSNCGGWNEPEDCLRAGECLLSRAMSDPFDGFDFDAYNREAYNRELEEESLGRPLFPNEY